MCYSAAVYAELRKLERTLGVKIDPDWYAAEFWTKRGGRGKNANKRPRMPRDLEREALARAPTEIQDAVRAADQAETVTLTQELFEQRARVVAAERALQSKETKKARENIRIGSGKVAAAQRRLHELKASQVMGPGRIYPGYYALVVVREGDRHVARPMRYRCRLPGWTEAVERRYPGTYNARRDRLESSWRNVFGHTHGVVVARAFYEHVDRDGRDQVVEFRPSDGRDMIAACLWTRTTDRYGNVLHSFAAVTDDPPPEVLAAGHDRCIIPIRQERLAEWLLPDPADLARLYDVLDDRERPYYEHRAAA